MISVCEQILNIQKLETFMNLMRNLKYFSKLKQNPIFIVKFTPIFSTSCLKLIEFLVIKHNRNLVKQVSKLHHWKCTRLVSVTLYLQSFHQKYLEFYISLLKIKFNHYTCSTYYLYYNRSFTIDFLSEKDKKKKCC